MIIGVDPHKSSHTATALDPATNTPIASLRVDATLAGYRQLHAVLRDLVPGGAELAITAKSASRLLRRVRPASASERTRKELAQDLVRELRTVDASLADIEKRMAAALDDHGSQLREVDGVGAITAV